MNTRSGVSKEALELSLLKGIMTMVIRKRHGSMICLVLKVGQSILKLLGHMERMEPRWLRG